MPHEPSSTSDGGLRETKGGLRSVGAAVELLDAFAEDEELGVSDVARKLGVAKSTAHRLLTTLAAGGLIERSEEFGHYRLGVRLIELGHLVSTRQDLRRMSAGVMEALREATGWTVHLTVVNGADALSLERLTTRRGMQVAGELRRRWPLHLTSAGKVLAAYDPGARDARVAEGFAVRTPSSIASAKQFDTELAEIRRAGYARARDELRPGLSSLAAPVLDMRRVARAAISIQGATADFDAEERRLADIVVAAGRRLSHTYQHAPRRDV